MTVHNILLLDIRALLDVCCEPLPVFLGISDGYRTGGSKVYVVVGVTTQDDRVNHNDLQCHVRVRNRELQLVIVVGVFPVRTTKLEICFQRSHNKSLSKMTESGRLASKTS